MDKSYVTLEQAVCPVCGVGHDTGNLLLDKRMRKRFDKYTPTHYAMCPEHLKLKNEGYVALIECKNEPTKLEDAIRTGQVAHIKDSAWAAVFNAPLPKNMVCFIQEGVIGGLEERVKGKS